jgi:hypothetical protein
MSTEEKMLPLQGIYQWFEKNTTKGGNEEPKGWQNSIRHNLSMNAVCVLSTPPHFPANKLILYRDSNPSRSRPQARNQQTTGASLKKQFEMVEFNQQPGIAK